MGSCSDRKPARADPPPETAAPWAVRRTAGVSVQPWLTNERLNLRRPGPADLASVFAIHGNLPTYLHLPSAVMSSPDEAALLHAAGEQHWQDHGFGNASVHRQSDGLVADAKHQRVLGQRILNLYYRFDPSAWGQGYATEAAEAIVSWFAARHPGRPAVARVATINPASVCVVERIGLVLHSQHDPGGPVEHVLCTPPLLRPWSG